MEFQIIGTAEDFSDRAALHGVDKRRAFPEVKPQNAVAKVSDGFIAHSFVRSGIGAAVCVTEASPRSHLHYRTRESLKHPLPAVICGFFVCF